MTDDRTEVDIQALEDFHATLATRRSDVESAIAKMSAELKKPQLGAFADATAHAAEVDGLHRQYARQMHRLHDAIVAAQEATSTIIRNYRSTERRNSVNATDIARTLGEVSVALNEGDQGV